MLILLGAESFSRLLTFAGQAAQVPIDNRGLTFQGASGVILMWAWNGLPGALAAAIAAIVFVKVIQTGKPVLWLVGLAALYLYSGVLRGAVLVLKFRVPPGLPDYIGIGIQAIMPALACLAAGVLSMKYFPADPAPSVLGSAI